MKKDLERKKKEEKEKAATKKKHWVRLTRRCNNNCMFCLDKDAQNGTALPLSSIRKNLQQGRDQHIDQVVLSGGEATIHPQFLEAVKMAKKMGYKHIQVITNGRMFAYNNFLLASVAAGVNEITFSIHGHNDKLHDKLTGVRGSFRQAITGLKNALEIPGLIVNQDIVINKQNCEQLDEIVEYFVALGIHEFDLLQIIPFGRAWEDRGELFYDMEKAMPRIKKALAFSRRPDVYIWTNRFPPQYLDGFEELIQHPNKLYDEINGRKDMFEAYLKKGKMMECRGERCGYCSLEMFCGDLIEFREKGQLSSRKIAMCLGKIKIGQKSKTIRKSGIICIQDFLNFFIQHRYFLKSKKCQICSSNSQCDGAQIDYIRENGFKSLKPISKGDKVRVIKKIK
ncbi:MAG: radical SAM protein [Parcubacteria group bacterium]|jgi:MoaA/NifB/PqqE/SkfB family radical SAM enzyme